MAETRIGLFTAANVRTLDIRASPKLTNFWAKLCRSASVMAESGFWRVSEAVLNQVDSSSHVYKFGVLFDS